MALRDLYEVSVCFDSERVCGYIVSIRAAPWRGYILHSSSHVGWKGHLHELSRFRGFAVIALSPTAREETG